MEEGLWMAYYLKVPGGVRPRHGVLYGSLLMAEPLDRNTVGAPPGWWSTEHILPDNFLPMLAASAARPLESSEHAYEVKWDGLRVLVGLERNRLISRTGAGQDPAFWLPELADARAAAEPEWVLLDGEAVILDEGRPSTALLQQRLKARHTEEVTRLSRRAPVMLIVYDILRIGDSWLLDVTWEERRDVLERALRPTETVRLSPVAGEGQLALDRARTLGLEAVVAKRLRGRYFPGERTRDWLNIKPLEVVDTVICGWTEGRGARSGTIGTLLLGAYRDGELVYVGHTGTGLDRETLQRLHAGLVAREQPAEPCRDVPALEARPFWVRPELVCRVRHQGWTETGKMRAPTFIELADEVSPLDCGLSHTKLEGRP